MSRLSTLTAAALAVAAIAPAASAAADNALHGQPQMFRVSPTTVRVNFVTDDKLGQKGTRITIADHGTATKVTANGRHGTDYRYVANIKIRRAIEVGKKYTVRLMLGDNETVVRKVLLRAQR
jgi:hypothetical protein